MRDDGLRLLPYYDYCNIGHARTMAGFDTMVRYLLHSGYQVTYVRNITDIDDKIIKRAQENNESFKALTERFIAALHEDAKALAILPPHHEPKATDYIDAMLVLIQKLVDQGFAYAAGNGDVYFDVSQFPAYGELSGQDLEKLRAGARVAVSHDKQDPLDFVLWKLAKPGEPSWPSPWGEGRPGWHIECSAMSQALLGDHFDLHGGGHDLLFPHHENELAQSACATHSPFVNGWLHVGFVQIDNEKMSKSLGNFFTIREILARYPAEVLRYFLIASHYRSPINYSDVALTAAEHALSRFYQALRGLDLANAEAGADNELLANYQSRFQAAMDDDFNTPEALAVLYDLVRDINRLKEQQQHEPAAQAGKLLQKLGEVLGILQQDPEIYFQGDAEADTTVIEKLIEERQSARQNKDWAKADAIRAQLLEQNIVLEDTSEGVMWRKG
jgi:cysteinyl-tRNA synthetase